MLKIYIYFLISILIHEISHIIIGKKYKITLKNLRVSIFGASIEIDGMKKNKTKEKILMYVSGPLSNFVIAIIFNFIKIPIEEKMKIIYINLSLGMFNLLPIIPLDGGNILKEIIKIKYNNIDANKISLLISKICLSILVFTYSVAIIKIKNISILILIVYLVYLNLVEERKIKLLERTQKIISKNSNLQVLEKRKKILQ